MCSQHAKIFGAVSTAQSYHGKWDFTSRLLLDLNDGESTLVSPFEGLDVGKFRGNLRSILSTGKGLSVIRWDTRVEGERVRVTRLGFWQDAVDVRGKESLEAEVRSKQAGVPVAKPKRPLPYSSHEVIESTKETTRVERTITVESPTTPAASPIIDVPVAPHVLPEIDGSPDAPEIAELFKVALRYYSSDPEDLTDVEAEEGIDMMSNLGEQIRAWEEAKPMTDALIREWAEKSPEAYRAAGVEGVRSLWSILNTSMRSRRLLEREARRHLPTIDKAKDPLGAENLSLLLPESDRKKWMRSTED